MIFRNIIRLILLLVVPVIVADAEEIAPRDPAAHLHLIEQCVNHGDPVATVEKLKIFVGKPSRVSVPTVSSETYFQKEKHSRIKQFYADVMREVGLFILENPRAFPQGLPSLVTLQHRERLGPLFEALTPYPYHNASLQQTLGPLAALVHIDPGSLGNLESLARDAVLAAWTGRDPEAAIAWAQQSHPNNMVGVIQSLASSDMARASQLLKDMPETVHRDRALSAILPLVLAQGADSAKAWISEITDQSLRARAVRDIAEYLAREDPAGTAAWLAKDPGEVANRSMANVMAIWGSQDPQAASQFIGALPGDHLRTLGLGGLVNQHALSDPRAAAALIDAHAADATDGTYQNFALQSSNSDPALAASYIARIQDPSNQFGTYTQLFDKWLSEDFTEASTWISENQLPENVSRYIDHRIREIELRKSIEESLTSPKD